MSTTRPFAYNPSGIPIAGTIQLGNLAIGYPTTGYTGTEWWNGPDEDLGYVIAQPVSGDTQPTQIFNKPEDGSKGWMELSPTFIGNSMNLTNNNQTVHQFFGYVQTVLGKTLIDNNDKVIFSFLCELSAPTTFPNGHFVGFGTTSMNYNVVVPDPYNSFPGNDNQSIGFNSGGEYWFNGVLQTSGLPSWTDTDIIDVAVDLPNNKVWIRRNNGDWNNDPSENPETATGGLSLNGLTSFYPALCPSYEGTYTIQNTSLYGVPNGFTLLGTNVTGSVGFFRSDSLTDGSFIGLTNSVFNQSFTSASEASTWLTTNGFWNSYPCLGIATNSGGGLNGWNPTAFDISPNPAVGTTYPVGSQITFQNGEVRTMVQVDDYSPIYMDIFYDSPISTATLFPITICS